MNNQLDPRFIVQVIFISLKVLIFLRIIMSWLFLNDRSNDFVEFVYSFTEPILKPFRVVIPMGMGGIDLSPILALIVLNFLEQIIIQLL
ncbi:MAG: YggT family protein [Candidatus Muiribacteriota bacterium]